MDKIIKKIIYEIEDLCEMYYLEAGIKPECIIVGKKKYRLSELKTNKQLHEALREIFNTKEKVYVMNQGNTMWNRPLIGHSKRLGDI